MQCVIHLASRVLMSRVAHFKSGAQKKLRHECSRRPRRIQYTRTVYILRLHVHRKSTRRWPTCDVGRTAFSALVYMFTIREVGHPILTERYGGAILENAELSRRLIVFVDALGR